MRREVIVPRARDALAFHRRIAVLSVLVAMLAGSLDAMLWRAAQRDADRRAAAASVERGQREALELRLAEDARGAHAEVRDVVLAEEVAGCPHDRAGR